MLTLGIETSGWSGSVALAQNGRVIGARTLDPTGRRHARTLVPEIQALLQQAGIGPRALELVAVSIGPGSFTGLRVGVVCAKTLAWAAGASLVAVDTYLAIAARCPGDVQEVQVVGDGQRGDLYVGPYVREPDGTWSRNGEIRIQSAGSWLAGLTESDVVTGPGLARHVEAAARVCRVLPQALWMPQAETIALLGERQAELGLLADPWSLEPFYLRRSAAEEKADASAASIGAARDSDNSAAGA